MLGLPQEDIATFYKLTVAQIITYPTMDNALDASAKLGRYFQAMLAERRANPGEDVVSVVATTEVDNEPLPENVAISFLRQLINAGGDTTFRTTAVLFTALLTNPDQLDAVRDDRSLVGAAVEEALRWDGPVLSSARDHGGRRPRGSAGAEGRAPRLVVRLGQPRSRGLRGPRPLRHLPSQAPTLRLRVRHPQLPGAAARPARAHAGPATRSSTSCPTFAWTRTFLRRIRGAMMRTPKELRVVFD